MEVKVTIHGKNRTIARALRIIAAHPNVNDIGTETVSESGRWWVDVNIRVGLPNAWIADGSSPNGVRAIEPITLLFPTCASLRAPAILLRADFNRSLAHVQPGDPGDRPEPCIIDGRLSELLHQQGLAGILNQLVLWLENAALGKLIDPKQGWEPVRRDDVAGFVVADASVLRERVSRDAGFAMCQFDYLISIDGDGTHSVFGHIGKDKITANPETFGRLLSASGDAEKFRYGKSIAVIVWPGRTASGELVVAGNYQPETVTNFETLRGRAAAYGVDRPLADAVNWLKKCAADYTLKRSYPVVFILCARRPFHIIGTSSSLEICPYVMDIGPGAFMAQGDSTPVQSIGHRHAISADLLRTMSGSSSASLSWGLIGAGSLGSKIALHLTRTGNGPAIVVDPGFLSPHNAARHALIPNAGYSGLRWIGSKAEALVEAVQGFGQTSTALDKDVVTILQDREVAGRHFPKKMWGLINTTASLMVREALGSVPPNVILPRVVEASLFANGQLGLLTAEGPERNPNTLDLIAEAYARIRVDEHLGTVVFSGGDTLVRRAIGEGCGSATMVMPDTRLSLFGASMAEAISQMQGSELPLNAGRLLIGRLSSDGFGLSWTDNAIPPVTIVSIEGPDTWSVRISRRAAEAMEADVTRWPGVETGGILMGRMSEAARTFYVTDVLPAPSDSVRSAHEFVLGVTGARRVISNFAESAGYSLFCLGTWHSHLEPLGPSGLDHRTADAVALARLAPSILLIHTEAGYKALLADAD
ncbi:Mov34/MPN/PAD-1 family protein [Acidocella aminolytica]|uniref:Mov34/MPN/PAD-1 family protein n=1 Tax=Acidocella aminolytica TaxID=33998 RepID=UPI000662A164|nr:Mov34/MPN/PAD-1 family protein [Acidocella aminolytica]